jgi:hypothetical protein
VRANSGSRSPATYRRPGSRQDVVAPPQRIGGTVVHGSASTSRQAAKRSGGRFEWACHPRRQERRKRWPRTARRGDVGDRGAGSRRWSALIRVGARNRQKDVWSAAHDSCRGSGRRCRRHCRCLRWSVGRRQATSEHRSGGRPVGAPQTQVGVVPGPPGWLVTDCRAWTTGPLLRPRTIGPVNGINPMLGAWQRYSISDARTGSTTPHPSRRRGRKHGAHRGQPGRRMETVISSGWNPLVRPAVAALLYTSVS